MSAAADVSPAVRGAECDTLIEDWLETDLDAWTRTVVARHFHPETGSPYRPRRSARRDVDARDITPYEQLTVFGPIPVDVLRSKDPADLVPLDVPRPPTGRARDTGGTTGTPCRVFRTPAMPLHRGAWRGWSFVTEGSTQGRTWLRATLTGPCLFGNGVREVSDRYVGQVFAVAMDPRRVERLVRAGRPADAAECTTRLPGVRPSVTQSSPDTNRDFEAAMDDGICGRGHGHIFGHAAVLPVRAELRTDAICSDPPAGDNECRTQRGLVNGGGIRHRRTGSIDRAARRPPLPDILERDQALRYDTGSG
ncbi:arylcarboxylate reductase [Streptomyces scabiei]|uniref:Uncharacterized protein n=1 Tax=Streptomyces scabiei TaxID=1930 RepID=A0A100JUD3_STRSC|nr:arylcarboxylate reductase [Streptomyces scabiei]GAQ65831.1 hypothetical protein SsS58_06246 [Streptomyces scabiei]